MSYKLKAKTREFNTKTNKYESHHLILRGETTSGRRERVRLDDKLFYELVDNILMQQNRKFSIFKCKHYHQYWWLFELIFFTRSNSLQFVETCAAQIIDWVNTRLRSKLDMLFRHFVGCRMNNDLKSLRESFLTIETFNDVYVKWKLLISHLIRLYNRNCTIIFSSAPLHKFCEVFTLPASLEFSPL